MRAILKATAVVSSSAFVTIAVGVVTAKAWALMVGPAGLGLAGVLWTFLALLAIVGGVGSGAGLVRALSASLAAEDGATAAHLRFASSLITAAVGLGLALALIVLREPISGLLGSAVRGVDLLAIAVALVFSLMGGVLTSTLNGYQRVGALATSAIAASVLGGVSSIGLVFWLGTAGIPVAIAATAFIGWLVALVIVRREVEPRAVATSTTEAIAAGRHLLSFGAGYVASLIPGTAVLFAIPVLVVHLLGLDEAGFYRAAAAISVGYLGFLIRAMGLEYYPRLAAAAARVDGISALVRQQQRVVMLLGVPLVLTAAAALPVLVPLLYTAEFGPTIDLLRWQLIGELPRFLAWTVAYVLIARGSMRPYLFVELIAGVVYLSVAVAGIQQVGLAGIGMAYAINTATYYVYVRLVVGRSVPMHLDVRLQALAAAIGVYLFALAAIGERAVGPATIAATVVALVAVVVCGTIVWRELRGRGTPGGSHDGRVGPAQEASAG